jgi:hypothetical protein
VKIKQSLVLAATTVGLSLLAFVRFVVTSHWGRSNTGFSEVQFESTPEPTSILGLLVLGGGLLATKRRKQEK